MQGVTKQVSGWGGVYSVGRMETYDGPAWRLISTLCGESATRNLANRSMRIQDVYVGAVPIPQFIKKKSPDTFDDSFTSTTCLYLSPSQLCLIKRESNFKHTHVHAEQDRVMRIGPRTQSIPDRAF